MASVTEAVVLTLTTTMRTSAPGGCDGQGLPGHRAVGLSAGATSTVSSAASPAPRNQLNGATGSRAGTNPTATATSADGTNTATARRLTPPR